MKNLLTESQAAKVIGVRPRTLAGWRYKGTGPAYVKISHRCVRYRHKDIERWAEERKYSHTTEEMEETL